MNPNACSPQSVVNARLATKLGALKEVADTIRDGGGFSDTGSGAVRRFTTAISSNCTQVSDRDVKASLAAGYDRRAVVGLALAAGAQTLVNTVTHRSRPVSDRGFQRSDAGLRAGLPSGVSLLSPNSTQPIHKEN
jgi:alkylhydroperoxidase family enzyme